jgi:hypothetical protein
VTGETQPEARPDLLAVCDVCLQLVEDGDGAVWCPSRGSDRRAAAG